MRLFATRKAIALTVVSAITIAGTGIAAFAYWTTTGTGSGSAAAGTSGAVSVTQTSTIAAMYPGGPSQAVDFKITNPGPSKQYIAGVTVSITSIKNGSVDAAGCSAADFTLVQPTAITQDLAVGDTSFAPSGASLAMKDLGTNQDGCKNVTVNLAFAAS